MMSIRLPVIGNKKICHDLNSSTFQGHESIDKKKALEAVDVLLTYKQTVHDFTDEIISFWSLPQKIMDRYQFDDVNQLNEWLDDMAH